MALITPTIRPATWRVGADNKRLVDDAIAAVVHPARWFTQQNCVHINRCHGVVKERLPPVVAVLIHFRFRLRYVGSVRNQGRKAHLSLLLVAPAQVDWGSTDDSRAGETIG